MEPALPTSVYVAIGILSVGNIGVLISMVVFIFKAGMFVSKTNLGIAEARRVADLAHTRIDNLKNSMK